MSIYSGFATRQQEESYDECLETVLYILQKRILRFYKNQSTDEQKFLNILTKIHNQMKSMEHHKYLQPKSSRTFEQLLTFLKNKQTEEPSLVPNKISETDELTDSELKKKYPLPITGQFEHLNPSNERNNQNGRSQKLQSKINEGSEYDKDYEMRPSTTNNRIRKRISSRSNNSNPQTHQNSNGNEGKQLQQNQAKNQIQVQRFQMQNILNSAAIKMVRGSRNEPRANFSSHQEIKQRKFSKSRAKDSESEAEPQPSGRESEVQNLIKGYINKTKKCYLRGFNKRRGQIDEMLKQI